MNWWEYEDRPKLAPLWFWEIPEKEVDIIVQFW